MKTIFLYGLALLLIASAAATHAPGHPFPTTEEPVPAIDAAITEPVTVSGSQILTSQNTPIGIFLHSMSTVYGPGTNIVSNTLSTFYRLLPVNWMQQGNYHLKFNITDQAGNRYPESWTFTVIPPGQGISLVHPEYGGTNETVISVTVRSELPSICRWESDEDLTYSTLTNSTFFISMKEFTSGDVPSTLHTVHDFFNATSTNITENVTVDLSVTCDSGVNKTARKFSIAYTGLAPIVEVMNEPNPITDPTEPFTNFTITSDQDVWCTVHNTPIFGERTFFNYFTVLRAQWQDLPRESTPRPVSVVCYNRAGLSTTVSHPLDYNYSMPLTITVRSPTLVGVASYQLNFTTNNRANCTVRQENSQVSFVGSNANVRNFVTQPRTLVSGENNFTITCTAELSPPVPPETVKVYADLDAPVLHNIIVPYSTCNLQGMTVEFNASDARYSSGMRGYNFSLQKTSGEIIRPWAVAETSIVPLNNLALTEGTQYVVKARAIDNLDKMSSEVTSPVILGSRANHSTCDASYPITTAEMQATPAGTNIVVACQDDRGCASTYYYQIAASCNIAPGQNNPNNAAQFGPLNGTTRISASPHVTKQTGKFCWVVYDTSGLASVGEPLALPTPLPQNVTLAQPASGGMFDKEESVVVTTVYPTVCKYSPSGSTTSSPAVFNGNFLRTFTSSEGGVIFTIDKFYETIGKNPAENDVTQLGVTCYDGQEFVNRTFTIQFLTQAPSFTVEQAPKPIVDITQPEATITVRAGQGQQLWCSLDDDDEFFSDEIEYRSVLQGTYDHSEKTAYGIVPVLVTCFNRAGLYTTQDYNITSNYTEAISIAVTSPTAVQSTGYTLNFTTNKNAECEVRKEGTRISRSTNTVFSIQSTLNQGKNTFDIECSTDTPELESAVQHIVTADSFAPTLQVLAAANTCSLQQLRFTLNATDPTSGVDKLTYNVTNKQTGATVITNKETTSRDITASADLVSGTSYTISAKATDEAGNSVTATADVTATASSASGCDSTPPVINMQKQSAANGTTITVTCQDTNGCSDNYYCTQSQDTVCVVDTSSPASRYSFSENKKPLVTQTSTVCCQVSDVAGNRKNASTQVTIQGTPLPPSGCTNGVKNGAESDVDCGGLFCAMEGRLCAIGKQCNTDGDCTSKMCRAGTCSSASCSDGFRNGNELGIDCGGTCPACSATTPVGCATNLDCPAGKSCDRGVCSSPSTTPREEIDYEEPSFTDGEGFGMLNIFLIASGLLSMLGGGAYVVLYKQPQKPAAPVHEPIAVFEPPVDRPVQQPEKPKQVPRRKGGKRRAIMADFDTPEELASRDSVSHKEIEHAFNKFDKKTFKEVTKQLLGDNKVRKNDVEVALADIVSKGGTDQEAIDDLRKEFNLKE